MKVAIIVFPGSNCDRDVAVAVEKIIGVKPKMHWHGDSSFDCNYDLIILPGGFSYGDYLRSGSIAARAPIVVEVKKAAEKGVRIIGICNGFQILAETGILPGTLMRNRGLKFICDTVTLQVANNNTPFTKKYNKNQLVKIPIAHHDGNYFINDDGLKALYNNEQIGFYYCNEKGEVDNRANPNGSVANIAGIFNKKGNVLGMMPHPERAVDILTGGEDGKALFASLCT